MAHVSDDDTEQALFAAACWVRHRQGARWRPIRLTKRGCALSQTEYGVSAQFLLSIFELCHSDPPPGKRQMTTHPVHEAWLRAFPDSAPAGFICRYTASDRWLRVHALPNGKRYATTPDERAEILRRYNTVGTDLLGDGAPCVLFLARFGENTDWDDDTTACLLPERPLHYLEYGAPDEPIQFFHLPVVWRAGDFDSFLEAKADDRMGPALFFNFEGRRAVAPYDGGADLFYAAPEEVAHGRRRYQQWISKRPDGL
jgi:hypothetical protein